MIGNGSSSLGRRRFLRRRLELLSSCSNSQMSLSTELPNEIELKKCQFKVLVKCFQSIKVFENHNKCFYLVGITKYYQFFKYFLALLLLDTRKVSLVIMLSFAYCYKIWPGPNMTTLSSTYCI